MTLNSQAQQERISLSGSNSATIEEIQHVWQLITEDRTITVRQIAVEIHCGKTKAFAIVTWLKQCGYISNKKHRYAWDVHLPCTGRQQ